MALLGLVVTYYVIPYIKAKTTKEQRRCCILVQLAVQIAEEIYKEKGQGQLKKETVIDFLNKNGIKMSIEQMDFLIDAIVTEFNKNGWDNVIVTMAYDKTKVVDSINELDSETKVVCCLLKVQEKKLRYKDIWNLQTTN